MDFKWDGDHILYLDITNQCSYNCDFCMYKKDRARDPINLEFNFISTKNLDRLINNSKISRINISGAGEPFNYINGILKILNISKGNNYFQLITNGFWITNENVYLLEKLNTLAKNKKDIYSIRLSIDSYHIEKANPKIYFNYFKYLSKNKWPFSNLRFSIRSVIEEKEIIRNFITRILHDQNISFCFKNISPLDDILSTKAGEINLIYRNIVNPPSRINSFNSIYNYIKLIEKKYGKEFKLGNLDTKNSTYGLNIGIKPNGDVYLYGAEYRLIGNINTDQICIEDIEDRVKNDCILQKLHELPMRQILLFLSKDEEFKRLINDINNPYWVIKHLYQKCDVKLLEMLKTL